jgi:hypothetical protein
MLRKAILIVGAVLLTISVVGVLTGSPGTTAAMIGPAAFGAVLMAAVLVERYIYKPIGNEPPGPGWDKTAERFADPRSGKDVTVYFNPATGQRRYVAEGTADNRV